MTTSAPDRAKELSGALVEKEPRHWESIIAAAITQAENDKLEEAARLCDGVTEELSAGRRQSHASPYFAALIRNLKSEGAR